MLLEGTTTKRIVAEGANKVLRMPLLAKGINTAGSDRLTTTSADGTSHLMVVLFTIRLALILKVGTTSKALMAVEAREVIRMPLLTHGIDELTTDGLSATSTLEREGRIEATLAERITITLQETTGERLQALRAHKVLRMPLLAKSSDTTISDRLITVSAMRTEETPPAVGASWLTIALIERGGTKRLMAALTSKVLRMPHLTHGLNHLTSDRLIAATADTTHGRHVGIID